MANEKNEQVFNLFFDISGQGTWELDTTGSYDDCNEERKIGLAQGQPFRMFLILPEVA